MSDFSVHTDLGEVTDLMARLGRMTAAAEGEAERIVARHTADGEARYTRRARRDTDRLRRSVTHRVDRRGAETIGRFGSPLPYAVVMEKGRRKGAPLPPPGVLLGWMRRHGIPASAEYVLRRAIARRGIRGDRVVETTVRALVPFVQNDAARIGPKLRALLAGGR